MNVLEIHERSPSSGIAQPQRSGRSGVFCPHWPLAAPESRPHAGRSDSTPRAPGTWNPSLGPTRNARRPVAGLGEGPGSGRSGARSNASAWVSMGWDPPEPGLSVPGPEPLPPKRVSLARPERQAQVHHESIPCAREPVSAPAVAPLAPQTSRSWPGRRVIVARTPRN